MKLSITISSLQIGQARWELEAAGAADVDDPPFSTEMREVRSWVSDENCEAEVCELREMLLADGDTALGFDCFNAEMFFPLPRTRPPPSILWDIIIRA